MLLDEIEKAHPDVFNLLLQVLEDGRLTDSQGRVVDFKNVVIIMTSNVGATGMTTSIDIGFRPQKDSGQTDEQNYEKMKNKVLEEVKHTFRPEFLNRVDEVVVFHQLTRAEIEEIVGLELNKVIREVKAQEMHLEVTEDAKAAAGQEGLGSAVRRASAASRDPARSRGRTRRRNAQGHASAPATGSSPKSIRTIRTS